MNNLINLGLAPGLSVDVLSGLGNLLGGVVGVVGGLLGGLL